ncbi:MAG: hypothetical protein VW576_03050 [Opitutae bacterium]
MANHLIAACLTTLFLFALNLSNPLALINSKKKPTRAVSIDWQSHKAQDQFKPKRKHFAEANPNVPDNIPDETDLLSTRNQQTAQPSPLLNQKNFNSLPNSNGDSQNLKVFQAAKPDAGKITPIKRNSNMASGAVNVTTVRKALGEDKPKQEGDGYHANSAQGEVPQKTIYLTPSVGDSIATIPDKAVQDRPPIFRSRPKLELDTINGPILRNSRNAAKVGKVAIDCRLNPYGVYMQEMLKSIESQWAELIENSFRYIQRDMLSGKITYTFTLLKSGKIEKLKEISQAQQTSLSSELCRQAIASRAPFGKWDDTMVKEFGHYDQISITFNYY